MATPLLIVGFGNSFDDIPRPYFETYDLAGTFLQRYDYATQLLGRTNLMGPIVLADGRLFWNSDLALLVTLNPDFSFNTAQGLLIPTGMIGESCPQLYASTQIAPVRVVGLWLVYDNAPPYDQHAILVDLDLTTLVQTPLWTDWAPVYMGQPGLITPYCLSKDGSTFYHAISYNGYPADGQIFATPLATGVPAVFITQYAPNYGPNNLWGQSPMWQLPDTTFLVLWASPTPNEYRVVQYDATGTPAGIDIVITDMLLPGFCIEPDGLHFWVIGTDPLTSNARLVRGLTADGSIVTDVLVPLLASNSYPTDPMVLIQITPAVVTGLTVDCTLSQLVIAGTDFAPNPTITVTGPSGPVAFTVVSVTATEIILQLTPPFVNGSYTVTVTNTE